MKSIVFLLEEPSAKEMLQGLLPRILPGNIQVYYQVFQGKQDMEKRLKLRLSGWKIPESSFVILRDQDSGNCKLIKQELKSIC